MPAARRACVTPGRAARRASAASAWASSVAAAASHSSAVSRCSQWAGSGPGISANLGASRSVGSQDPVLGPRQILFGVDLAPEAVDEERSQRHAARGERVEPVAEVGLVQRGGGAERGVLRPRGARLAPDLAQRRGPLGREARQADELAGGLFGRDQPLADAGDRARRRRPRRRGPARPRSPGGACAPRRRRASGDRSPAPPVPAPRPAGGRARARTRCRSRRTGTRPSSRARRRTARSRCCSRPSRGSRRSAAAGQPAGGAILSPR